jgi:hypothetical protein
MSEKEDLINIETNNYITKESRLGEMGKNEFGSVIKIIRYKDCTDLDILFTEYDWVYKNARYDYFENGHIKCPYERRTMNIGYLGEGDYKFNADDKYDKRYGAWQHMLIRCYSSKYHEKKPTYIGCSVCDEWHNYQNFAKWYDENYYEIKNEMMCLDKDILVKGNKVYSPETCVFVPQIINSLFTNCRNKRGNLPIGVTKDGNNYRVRVGNPLENKRVDVGHRNNTNDAFALYKTAKENIIKLVAEFYKKYIPNILYNAMYRYEIEITD